MGAFFVKQNASDVLTTLSTGWWISLLDLDYLVKSQLNIYLALFRREL